MINIYDSANKLAEDLTQTDQYKALAIKFKTTSKSFHFFKLNKVYTNCLTISKRPTLSQLMIFMKILENRICNEVYSLCRCAFR